MRAIVFALVLAACAHEPAAQAVSNPLAGTAWRRVDDLDANPHRATLAFEQDRAHGSTGCNRWFGAAHVSDARLDFDSIGTTRMACAEVQMATERNFLDVLARAARYRLDDADTLTVMSADGAALAQFTREP